MCDRPIPFHMVKEMWLCVPGNNQSGGFQEIEKILDYTLEDEICTEIADPMTPAAYEMRDHRRLERILELLCEFAKRTTREHESGDHFPIGHKQTGMCTMHTSAKQSNSSSFTRRQSWKQGQAEIGTSDSEYAHGA